MWVSGRVITWRANAKRARAMAAVEAEHEDAPRESAPDQQTRPAANQGSAQLPDACPSIG